MAKGWVILSLQFSFVGLASAQSASLLGCLDCFNFTAPSILSADSITPAETGLIVYESSTNTFRGYKQSGQWANLSNERRIRAVTGSTNVLISDNMVLASNTSGPITLYLPSAPTCPGQEFTLMREGISSGEVTISASTDLIAGYPTVVLRASNDSITVFSTGSTWKVSTSRRAPRVTKLTGSGVFGVDGGVLYLRVRMFGGGGGGGGSGTSGSTSGGDGGATTFGANLLMATGGYGGNKDGLNVGGGGVGINLPANGTGIAGAQGNGTSRQSGNQFIAGGAGGGSAFGGAGAGALNAQGGPGATNSGSGGGGSGGNSTLGVVSAGGGGAGGFVDSVIVAPTATYSYSVGLGGTAGAAGANGYMGGPGGGGLIEITEYYQ